MNTLIIHRSWVQIWVSIIHFQKNHADHSPKVTSLIFRVTWSFLAWSIVPLSLYTTSPCLSKAWRQCKGMPLVRAVPYTELCSLPHYPTLLWHCYPWWVQKCSGLWCFLPHCFDPGLSAFPVCQYVFPYSQKFPAQLAKNAFLHSLLAYDETLDNNSEVAWGSDLTHPWILPSRFISHNSRRYRERLLFLLRLLRLWKLYFTFILQNSRISYSEFSIQNSLYH